MLNGLRQQKFYFHHSQEIHCEEKKYISSLSKYEQYSFISSIFKDNFYGVQFHPELSRNAGIKLLKNFINL